LPARNASSVTNAIAATIHGRDADADGRAAVVAEGDNDAG
jgi:hypothetical protein